MQAQAYPPFFDSVILGAVHHAVSYTHLIDAKSKRSISKVTLIARLQKHLIAHLVLLSLIHIFPYCVLKGVHSWKTTQVSSRGYAIVIKVVIPAMISVLAVVPLSLSCLLYTSLILRGIPAQQGGRNRN